ncbi:hypothetical protein L6470_10070 [Prevotella communis]|jgi:rhodanese-related sulfurtransferase|uniref:hypothetical protein n=2 Tax=Prevotella communis TaxID=2913614 RepID=UPI001EDAA718|nr:hypothetical protein [Prevotella communis]UKK58711.1 hypothetical protein L6470_10070 [Prevotella communis]
MMIKKYMRKLMAFFVALLGLTAGRLAGVGYKCVNLIGGIIAWKAAEMPVIKENNK